MSLHCEPKTSVDDQIETPIFMSPLAVEVCADAPLFEALLVFPAPVPLPQATSPIAIVAVNAVANILLKIFFIFYLLFLVRLFLFIFYIFICYHHNFIYNFNQDISIISIIKLYLNAKLCCHYILNILNYMIILNYNCLTLSIFNIFDHFYRAKHK